MQVAVIGAGLSGLLVSHELKKLGLTPVVFEKEPEIPSKTLILPLFDEVRTLAKELSVEIFPLKEQRRCIYKDGRLLSFRASVFSLLTSGIFSLSELSSILKEPFIKPIKDDESVANFVRRRFDSKILENFAEPLVSELCLGDVERLSLKFAVRRVYELEKKSSSVVKGVLRGDLKLPELGFSKEGGLIKGLLRDLSVKFENVVLRVRKKDGEFILEAKDGKHKFSSVVVCTPAWVCAYMLRDLSWSACEVLEDVFYAPFILVRATLKLSIPCHSVLFPSSHGFRIRRIFLSDFEDGIIYLGGAKDGEILDLSDNEIITLLKSELLNIFGAQEVKILAIERYKRAIPQFNLGHDKVLDIVSALESENPGLFIGSRFVFGPSILDSIAGAKEIAKRVFAYLNK